MNEIFEVRGYMKIRQEEELFSSRVKSMIKRIPYGKVATYGQIAALSGNHRAARQVAWILHSSSEKNKLPWHRVVNRRGEISLEPGFGYEEQKHLIIKEGIRFDKKDRIDLEHFLWNPGGVI
jgi:methylated-DNA-protein-cysteine methyltransferase-like protein